MVKPGDRFKLRKPYIQPSAVGEMTTRVGATVRVIKLTVFEGQPAVVVKMSGGFPVVLTFDELREYTGAEVA
jgi:hypothetical protein